MKTINLTATKVSDYTRKSDGKGMTLYTLTGDKESLAFYKSEKAEFYGEDEDGKPYFNAPQSAFIGNVVKLRHAPNSTMKFFIDDRAFQEESAIMANRAKAIGASKSDVLEALAKTMVSAPQPVQGELFPEESESSDDLNQL